MGRERPGFSRFVFLEKQGDFLAKVGYDGRVCRSKEGGKAVFCPMEERI